MLQLPENPTPQQLNGICLAIVRATFEDSASDFIGPEPLEGGGWKGTYSVDETQMAIEYTNGEFVKWPVGGGQDG